MAKGLSVVKPAIRNYNVDDEEFVDTAAAVFSDVVNFIYKLRQRYSIMGVNIKVAWRIVSSKHNYVNKLA